MVGDGAHDRGLRVVGRLAGQGDGALHVDAVQTQVLNPGAAQAVLVQRLGDVELAARVLGVDVGEDHVVDAAAVVGVELAQDAVAVLPVAAAAYEGDGRLLLGLHLHQERVRIAHREHVDLEPGHL